MVRTTPRKKRNRRSRTDRFHYMWHFFGIGHASPWPAPLPTPSRVQGWPLCGHAR